MSDEYINQVILDYKNKLEKGILPQLANLTPAKLRTECENVFKERYSPLEDDPKLRSFFGPADNDRNYSQIIRNFDVDKFRPPR